MNPSSTGDPTPGPAGAWWGADTISDAQADAWVAKGRRCAAPMLALAGPAADPAPVLPARVASARDGVYGNFMLAWLDSDTDPRRVRHLPDGAFFLRLLRLAYEPVLTRRPDLAALLADTSRLEMSLTNDVLQIQLTTLPEGYSMIRHHALMLFHAALWLDEPRRSQWLELYDELVGYVAGRPEGRPDLAGLAEVEAGAFADFTALAPRTLDPAGATALLDDRAALARVLDYQLYAGVAIGLLGRAYQALPEPRREDWHRRQLSDGYLRLDYLEKDWTDLT
jgi:hypothetical protein